MGSPKPRCRLRNLMIQAQQMTPDCQLPHSALTTFVHPSSSKHPASPDRILQQLCIAQGTWQAAFCPVLRSAPASDSCDISLLACARSQNITIPYLHHSLQDTGSISRPISTSSLSLLPQVDAPLYPNHLAKKSWLVLKQLRQPPQSARSLKFQISPRPSMISPAS
jgi:hypothetical protein